MFSPDASTTQIRTIVKRVSQRFESTMKGREMANAITAPTRTFCSQGGPDPPSIAEMGFKPTFASEPISISAEADFPVESTILGLLRYVGTQETRRLERQQHDENHKGERILVLGAHGQIGSAQRFNHSQYQTTHERPRNVADSSQYGGDESLQPWDEPHVRTGEVINRSIKSACQRSHGRADNKGDGDNAVNIDTHQR